MQIEPWGIPVLAMALLTLPPSVHFLVERAHSRSDGDKKGKRREWLRAAIFAVTTVVLGGAFIVALGPDLADAVISVASGVAAVISAVMAVQSGRNATGRADRLADTGVPARVEPPSTPTADQARGSGGRQGRAAGAADGPDGAEEGETD